MSSPIVEIHSPMPANVDAERFLLGAILDDCSGFLAVAGSLAATDFSLEVHQRIFLRMNELHARGEKIDSVTVANELDAHRQLKSIGGLTYLVSLGKDLPRLHNLASYAAIIKEKALLRRAVLLSRDTMHRALQGETTAELATSASDAWMKLSAPPKKGLASPAQIVAECNGAFLDPSQRVLGIATGFTQFDEMTGGLCAGELIILAARPAMGKTALALNIAQHVATHPKTPKAVAIFSLEMSKESLLTRLLCGTARVDQRRFRAGYLNQNEKHLLQIALDHVLNAPLFLDDTAGTNLLDLHAKLRRLRNEQNLGLVIVDYLQLLEARGRFENRVQEIGSLSRGLKLLAKELHLPFLVLSQLSRAPETRPGDHRPILSDLRESGSIEADADMVAFIFREEVYRPDNESLKGIAELILAKQRNGPTGTAKLAFLNTYAKFENLAGGIV